MFDEKSLRRTTFQEGIEVKLADGQTWTFPRPRMSFKPRFVEGKIKIDSPSFGPEFDPYYDVIFGTKDHEGWELQEAKCTIAWLLLRANYDLPEDALPELFSFEPRDTASADMWNAVMDAVLGHNPNADGQDT